MSWSVLQSKSNSSASATTIAATYNNNLAAGSKLIAYVSSATKTISSVGDGTNNFTQLSRSAQTNYNLYVFALDVPAADIGAKPTITATASGSDPGLAILIQEVSGLLPGNTTAMVDGAVVTSHGSSTLSSFTTGTPAYSSTAVNEFLIAIYGDDGSQGGTGNTWTAPGGYTTDANSINSNTHVNLSVNYANSTGGAESDGFSVTNGNVTANWGLALFAFKLAVPGAGNPPPVAPPGRQSPMILGVPVSTLPQAPQSPPTGQATPVTELTPPGRVSPMSLGVPLSSPTSAPPTGPLTPPVPYVPGTETPLTPPGRQSPVSLGLGLTAPSPAPQSPPVGQAVPTPRVPPGFQSPMALSAYLPPGSPAAAPVPPPPPVPGYSPLTPPGRASPMSIGLPLYAPSPGPQTPPTPAAVVVTLALAGMLDRRPGYLKKRILLGI